MGSYLWGRTVRNLTHSHVFNNYYHVTCIRRIGMVTSAITMMRKTGSRFHITSQSCNVGMWALTGLRRTLNVSRKPLSMTCECLRTNSWLSWDRASIRSPGSCVSLMNFVLSPEDTSYPLARVQTRSADLLARTRMLCLCFFGRLCVDTELVLTPTTTVIATRVFAFSE